MERASPSTNPSPSHIRRWQCRWRPNDGSVSQGIFAVCQLVGGRHDRPLRIWRRIQGFRGGSAGLRVLSQCFVTRKKGLKGPFSTILVDDGSENTCSALYSGWCQMGMAGRGDCEEDFFVGRLLARSVPRRRGRFDDVDISASAFFISKLIRSCCNDWQSRYTETHVVNV